MAGEFTPSDVHRVTFELKDGTTESLSGEDAITFWKHVMDMERQIGTRWRGVSGAAFPEMEWD